MKRVVTVIVSLAAGAASLVTVAPAASAYNGYTASATGVNYTADKCFSAHVTISGFNPSYEADGRDIEVTAPDGSWVDGDYAWGQSSISLSPLLCNGIDPTGRYSVRVDGTEVTAFTVARPAISTRVVAAGTRRARVEGRLTLRGRAMASRRVMVQFRQSGYWYDAKGFTTNANGVVAIQCVKRGYSRPCATSTYRYAFNDVAVSRAFHLPTRRR